MLLLLDTHILLALARDEVDQLPKPVREALSSTRNALFASVASLWEIAIKNRSGKLASPCALDTWPAALSSLAISLMEIHASHVLGEADPSPPGTKDPFDHLLLAVCRAEQMQLVTLDRALVHHPLAWRPASA